MPISKRHTLHLVAIFSAALLWGAYDHIENQKAFRRAYFSIIEAQELERLGKLQDAYRNYSPLCEGSVIGFTHGGLACEGARRLSINIIKSYNNTMTALNKYRYKNGRFPDTLNEVQEQIPVESIQAFLGFRYIRKSDSKADIVTGLYGSSGFSLD